MEMRNFRTSHVLIAFFPSFFSREYFINPQWEQESKKSQRTKADVITYFPGFRPGYLRAFRKDRTSEEQLIPCSLVVNKGFFKKREIISLLEHLSCVATFVDLT